MRKVKVFLADGNSFISCINRTDKEIRQYYEGSRMNMGTVDDDMQKVTKVEILE